MVAVQVADLRDLVVAQFPLGGIQPVVGVGPLVHRVGDAGADAELPGGAVGQLEGHLVGLGQQGLGVAVSAVVGPHHHIEGALFTLHVLQIGHGVEHGTHLIGVGAAVDQRLASGDPAVKDIDIHVARRVLQVRIVVAQPDHTGDVGIFGVQHVVLLLLEIDLPCQHADQGHHEQNGNVWDQTLVFHFRSPFI